MFTIVVCYSNSQKILRLQSSLPRKSLASLHVTFSYHGNPPEPEPFFVDSHPFIYIIIYIYIHIPHDHGSKLLPPNDMSIIPCIILEPQGFNEIMVFKIAREYPQYIIPTRMILSILFTSIDYQQKWLQSHFVHPKKSPTHLCLWPLYNLPNIASRHPGGHHKSLQLVP